MNQETLSSLIGQNGRYVAVNAAGITEEESLLPSPGGANTFHWILGHVAFWRNAVLQMAEIEPVWDEGEGRQYRGHPEGRRPSTFQTCDAVRHEQLVADLESMQRRLKTWATGGEREPPERFLNLLLHEAYHAGQLGILRRALGKEGAV